MILSIVVIILSIAADYLSKYLIVQNLDALPKVIIPHIVEFTYVENKGAAFGMLSNNRWIFMGLSAIMIIAIAIYLFVESKKLTALDKISLALIVGGGIGNMIDRIALGYVVDFINALFVDFYVFNIADSCVCVGCGLLVISQIYQTAKEAKAKKSLSSEPDSKEDESDASEVTVTYSDAKEDDNAIADLTVSDKDSTSAADKNESAEDKNGY